MSSWILLHYPKGHMVLILTVTQNFYFCVCDPCRCQPGVKLRLFWSTLAEMLLLSFHLAPLLAALILAEICGL